MVDVVVIDDMDTMAIAAPAGTRMADDRGAAEKGLHTIVVEMDPQAPTEKNWARSTAMARCRHKNPDDRGWRNFARRDHPDALASFPWNADKRGLAPIGCLQNRAHQGKIYMSDSEVFADRMLSPGLARVSEAAAIAAARLIGRGDGKFGLTAPLPRVGSGRVPASTVGRAPRGHPP